MIEYATIPELKREHNKELTALKERQANALHRLVKDRFRNGSDGIKVGDIITDHFQTICVESVQYNESSSCSDVKYAGVRLTRHRHVPYKNGQRGIVFSSRIKTIKEAVDD